MNEGNTWYKKPEISGGRQFLYIVLLAIGGFVLSNLFSAFIIITSPNAHISDIEKNTLPYSVSLIIQTVGTFIFFAIPAIIFSKIVKVRRDYFYFKQKSSIYLWICVIIILGASLFCSGLFASFNEWIPLPKKAADFFKEAEKGFSNAAISMINFKTIGNTILSFIVIALLPAMFEELFFRGALQQALTKWIKNPYTAIIIASIIFSAVHLSYYGFLVRFILGMVLGLVYFYGKNIWLNILIHFMNNAIVLISLYVTYQDKPIPVDALDDKSSVSIYLQFLALIILIVALIFFIKKSKQQIPNHTS